jgi:hypothetical protein
MKSMPSNGSLMFATAIFFLSIFQLYGCTSAAALRGEEGKNTSSIQVGLSRSDAESILGSPVREWLTSENIRYCVYRYDGGVPPSDSDAIGYALMNAMSLGLFEFFEATGMSKLSNQYNSQRRVWRQIAVAYDNQDRIVGVFDNFGDFDVLPADGRVKR